MTIATAKNTPRNSYTASGSQTDFTIGFEFFSVNDIKVYKNGTLMTYNASPSSNTQYKITGTASGSDSAYEFGAGGTVTFGSGLSASDSVVIIRDIVIERTTDFTPSGTFDIQTLNTELDKIYALIAEQDQQSARSVKLLDTDTFEFDSDGNVTVGTGTIGVTASADELNILDGCTLTTTELNQFDGFTIADEDDMSSNSATKLSTQQSIKAYVDSQIATEDTIQELNDTDISSLASGHILIWDGSDSFDNKPISGDVTLASTGAITIANNAVETAMINADAVTNAKIADDSIDSEHYVDGSIDTAHIGDLQVTTAKIAADAITGAKLADDAVNSEHYTDGSIDTAHIGDLQVTTAKIAADAITGAKIADDAISEEHLDPTVISGLTDATIASTDHLMFFDATDSQLKKVDAAELGVGSGLANVVDDTSPQLGGTLDANGNAIDMNGLADGIILDTDGDTTISAPTDDQIDIEIAGADDFTFTANTFTALSGSDIVHADSGSVRNRPNSKPLIINGGMTVAQRGTVTGITNPGAYGGPDRVRADIRGGFTVQVAQSTDVPSGYGFANSAKLDVTTADTSPDANGLLLLVYSFEGQDVQLLKYGTSSAETVTIAFWIKSNKTGTFQVNLRMVEAYHIGQLVTISSANTWEKKVITFAGNTSNAMANDNSNELRIQFFFDAGSDSEGGGVPSSWAAVNEAKSYNGSIDLGDNTANEVLITGLQMEVGEYNSDTIPEFQHESFSDSLQRCQRYYEKSYNATTDPGTATLVGVRHGSGVAGQTGTGEIAMGIYFLTPKRTTPTITLYDRLGNSGKCSRADLGTAEHTNSTASAVHTGENAFAVSSGSGSAGSTMHCHFEAAAEL